MKTKYFECDCQAAEHTVRFVWFPGEGTDMPWDEEEIYIEIHLNRWLPWYKKIYVAFMYLFNKETFQPYDSTTLSKEKVHELRDWLKEMTGDTCKGLLEDKEKRMKCGYCNSELVSIDGYGQCNNCSCPNFSGESIIPKAIKEYIDQKFEKIYDDIEAYSLYLINTKLPEASGFTDLSDRITCLENKK